MMPLIWIHRIACLLQNLECTHKGPIIWDRRSIKFLYFRSRLWLFRLFSWEILSACYYLKPTCILEKYRHWGVRSHWTITITVFFFFSLQAQLTVTPQLEGALKIVGVRWKLSGSVAGFCTFATEMVKKKVQKKRGKTKRRMVDNLEFIVIKVHGFCVFLHPALLSYTS